MTHSVRSHLRVEIAAYDETIRRFIPGYAQGLALHHVPTMREKRALHQVLDDC